MNLGIALLYDSIKTAIKISTIVSEKYMSNLTNIKYICKYICKCIIDSIRKVFGLFVYPEQGL